MVLVLTPVGAEGKPLAVWEGSRDGLMPDYDQVRRSLRGRHGSRVARPRCGGLAGCAGGEGRTAAAAFGCQEVGNADRPTTSLGGNPPRMVRSRWSPDRACPK